MQTDSAAVGTTERNPRRGLIAILFVVLLGATFFYWRWTQDALQRESLATLGQLDLALRGGGDRALAHLLVLPASIRERSPAEQAEFLTKTLRDEISAEGVAALKSQGTYGPLKKVFPAEAELWAQRAGVSVDDCVAFRMEREGVRCEVVLVKASTLNPSPGRSTPRPGPPSTAPAPYLILRVNNVKQMAESQLLATEKHR